MENKKNLPEKVNVYNGIEYINTYQYSLRDIFMIFFRQKNLILLVFVFTVFSISIWSFFSPEIFQSDAKLFVQLGRENISVDPSVVGPTTPVRFDRESEINSEVAALKSRVLVEQVVAEVGPSAILMAKGEEPAADSESQLADMGSGLLVRLGLKKPVPPNEIAIAKVMENTSVGTDAQSNIIYASYQAENPKLAQNILNLLIEKYLDRHIVMHQTQAPLQFVEARANNLKEVLEQKEDALKQFQKQNSMSSMEGQKTKVLEQVNLIQIEIDRVAGLVGASSATIESLKKDLSGRSPKRELNRVIGRPNRAEEAIKDRLFELKTQEADLAARYPDSDRALINLRDKIKLVERQLSRESATHAEITEGVDTNYLALQLNLANEQAQLQALLARQKVLKTELAKRQQSLLEISPKEIDLQRIMREINIASSEYQKYRDNLQRAKMSSDLDSSKISNINIVQPATFSLIPIKPKKKIIILIGILLGGFLGVGAAFLREYFDNTIKVPQDVELRLDIPVLACTSRSEFKF